MDGERADIKSRIVAAAAEIVGGQIGVNLTIRELAKKANVNIAAVNYYFESKDNLMQEVEQSFADEFKKINMSLSLKDDLSPRERLLRWAEMLMSYLMENPGTISMFVVNVVSGWNSSLIPELLKGLGNYLLPVVKKLIKGDDFNTAYMACLHIMSCIITPILIYHAAGTGLDIDISDQNCRKEYIKSFLSYFD